MVSAFKRRRLASHSREIEAAFKECPILRSPHHRALRKHEGSRTSTYEGSGDYLLRMPQAVNGGRVDPVDSGVQRSVDRHDRLGVVLRAPTKIPAPSANRPGAHA